MSTSAINLTPANNQLYATLSELKLYMNIDDNDDDALLSSLIARATSLIDTITHRRFIPVTATRYYTLDYVADLRTLFLDSDLYSLTSLVNGNEEVISNSDVDLMPRNNPPYQRISAHTNTIWQCINDQEIAVTGQWGYSATPPIVITHACIRLTSWFYRMRSNQNTDMDRPLVSQEGVMLMPAVIPADIKMMLNKYTRKSYLPVPML